MGVGCVVIWRTFVSLELMCFEILTTTILEIALLRAAGLLENFPSCFNATPLFLWHRKGEHFKVQCLPLTVSESAKYLPILWASMRHLSPNPDSGKLRLLRL